MNKKELKRKGNGIMKNFKYATLFLSGVFCLGIMGSLELDRISLSEAFGYVAFDAALCLAVTVAEAALKFLKLLAIYLKRKQTQNKGKKHIASRFCPQV